MANQKSFLYPGQPFVNIKVGAGSDRLNADRGSFGGRGVTTLLQERHFRSLRARFVTSGSGVGDTIDLELFDPNFGELAELFFSKDMTFSVQFGWRGTVRDSKGRDVKAPRTQERVFQINSFKSRLARDGEFITISAVGRGMIRALYGTSARAYDSKFSSSQIARRIIENELGLQAIIEDTKDAGKGETKHLRPGDATAYDYITQHLVPRVKGATGEEFSFYITEGQGFFVSKTHKRTLLYDQYFYQREMDGRVLSFDTSYEHLQMAIRGGTNSRFEGYNMRDKTVPSSERVRGDDSDRPSQDDSAKIPLGKRVPKVPPLDQRSENGRYYAVPYQTQEEVDAYATHYFNNVQRTNVTGNLEIVGDPLLPIADRVLLSINVLRPDGELHPMSGIWFPITVEHSIDVSGRFTSNVRVQRYALDVGDLEVVGAESTFGFKQLDTSLLSQDALKKFAQAVKDPSRAGLGFTKKATSLTGR